jgi:hypothetical protein
MVIIQIHFDIGYDFVNTVYKFEKWLIENVGRRNYSWKRLGWDYKNRSWAYRIRSPKKAIWIKLIWG